MRRKSPKILPRIFLVLILTLVSVIFYFCNPFLVKNIIVTTDYDVSGNKELLKDLERIKNKNIFFLNEKELAQLVKGKDLKIKEVLVKKEYPQTLRVSIERREASGVVPVGSSFYSIDKEGLAFCEEKEVAGLPIIDLGLQNIGVGSRIDDREKNIFAILDSLKGKEEVVRIWVAGEEIQVQLSGGTLALFPHQGGIDTKLNALQTIIARFRIEGKRPEKIDLRFEKPVVTF